MNDLCSNRWKAVGVERKNAFLPKLVDVGKLVFIRFLLHQHRHRSEVPVCLRAQLEKATGLDGTTFLYVWVSKENK